MAANFVESRQLPLEDENGILRRGRVKVLCLFIELADRKDYFNDFCDDENQNCRLYDYVENLLADEKRLRADEIAHALAGIKMAISSDHHIKSIFEHSIDKLTGLRYPALVDMLLKNAGENMNK
jgi:hypothetical protein